MASIEKRVRNDKVSYRARYRGPSGRQRVRPSVARSMRRSIWP